MDRILVIGATGQLGWATSQKLRNTGARIRALVRSPESAARMRDFGIEPVLRDLTDPASLIQACAGMTTVIATANVAVPTRPGDTFEAVERRGYRSLIEAAKAARIRRFVYISVPLSQHTRLSQLIQFKRETEQALAESGLDYVVFRAGIFMDVAFAMMGTAIPIQNSENATVQRPCAFVNRHFARVKHSIEKGRVALIPGDGTARHGFICIDDVANFLASAAVSGPSGVHSIGGPERLSFLDIVRVYEGILGSTLRARHTPAGIFRSAAALLRSFSPAAANLMALNYIAATEDSPADCGAAAAFGVRLTSAEAFLRAKSASAAVRQAGA